MFSNLKNQIIDLARNAVLVAEDKLGSGNGQEKKKLAIEYVLNNLPLPNWLKYVISVLLSSFIDDVIEIAVQYMKSLSTVKGEE